MPQPKRGGRRAAIYARYSSEKQNENSIRDQIEVCRRYADQQGLEVVEVFSDAAISGACGANRPDYQALLQAARENRFEVIVVEALDRLARSLADIAGVHDELRFRGVELHATNIGEATPMHVGMLGTMAQMYLADLSEKAWRGGLGRIGEGRAAAGKAFGYDMVEGEVRGIRVINEAEAAVVRRIFTLYADGVSPRHIAQLLNAEGIPGPTGSPWWDTAIRGQRARGTGILNNELYIGRLVWNRCSYVKNPSTGKRVPRPNPESEWEIAEVPHLRIIPDDLWLAVKRRQDDVTVEMARDDQGNALNRVHRKRYLLSGLLHCAACGGRFTIMGKDRYGCATARGKGTCTNKKTVTRDVIEDRVLSALRDRLMAPDLVNDFIKEYNRTLSEEQKQRRQDVHVAERELADVKRKIAGIIRAIENDLYTDSMNNRMRDLEARKTQLEAMIAATPEAQPVVAISPDLSALYARQIADLVAALNREDTRHEAIAVLQRLISKVVITPAPAAPDGIELEVHGALAELLALAHGQAPNTKLPGAIGRPGSQVSVVAGARNRLNLLFEAPSLNI